MKLFKRILLNGLISCSVFVLSITNTQFINSAEPMPAFSPDQLPPLPPEMEAEFKKIFDSPEFQQEIKKEYDKMSKMSDKELEDYVGGKMKELDEVLNDPEVKKNMEQMFKEAPGMKPAEPVAPVKEEVQEPVTKIKKEDESLSCEAQKLKTVFENIIKRAADILKKGQALPRVSPEMKYEDQWAKLKNSLSHVESYLRIIVKRPKLLSAFTTDEFKDLRTNLEELSKELTKQEPKFRVPDTMQLRKVYTQADKPTDVDYSPAQEDLKKYILPLWPKIEEQNLSTELRSFLQKLAPKELKEYEDSKKSFAPAATATTQEPVRPAYTPSGSTADRHQSFGGGWAPDFSGPSYNPGSFPSYRSGGEFKPGEQLSPEARAKKEALEKAKQQKMVPSFPQAPAPVTPKSQNELNVDEFGKSLKSLSSSLKKIEKIKDQKGQADLAFGGGEEFKNADKDYDKVIDVAKKLKSTMDKMPDAGKKAIQTRVQSMFKDPELKLEKYYELMKKTNEKFQPEESTAKEQNKKDPCDVAKAKVQLDPKVKSINIRLSTQLTKTIAKHECLKSLLSDKKEKEETEESDEE